MTSPDRRDELHHKIDRLAGPEVVVVDRFVDAVLTPVEETLADGSWLTVQPWAEAFLARLRAHHALSAEPLSTTAFEAAFNSACESAGWDVRPASSATTRFFDTVVVIPGTGEARLSLKTTAARNMSRRRVHISKLTEAAWIQDARTQAGRHEQIVELFRTYRDETDCIIVLRCFREADGRLLYELIEIPTQVFASVEELTLAEAQASTIPIPPRADEPDARIRVDRSDAKITVTGIRIEVCTVHGEWLIPDLTDAGEATVEER